MGNVSDPVRPSHLCATLRVIVPGRLRARITRLIETLLRPIVASCVAPHLDAARAEAEERLRAELAALQTGIEQRLAADEAALAGLRDSFEARLVAALDALRAGVEQRLATDEAILAGLRDGFEARLVAALDALRMGVDQRLATDENVLGSVQGALERVERQLFAMPYVNPNFDRPSPDAAGAEFDYAGFEQKFRGPSKVVEEKLRFYVPYVQGLSPVVDLGCGRGEFLSVLREAGTKALGVEVHPGQINECRGKDLEVVHADMFDYLDSVSDGSLGAVFSAQVIEHIGWARLNTLFKLAFQKIQPGGLMIAETVNPHCPAAFKFFWLDPTHVAPLFPEAVQFLAEAAGFDEVQIVYPVVDGDPRRAYHDCGDYAVVARRPS